MGSHITQRATEGRKNGRKEERKEEREKGKRESILNGTSNKKYLLPFKSVQIS